MNRLKKVKKLNVVLQYTPAVIAFVFALSLWRADSNAGAVLFGLIGIVLMLLSVLLNIIRKVVGDDGRLRIVLAIVLFFCSLFLGIKGEIYHCLIIMLGSIFIILGHLLHSQKQTDSKWSSSVWQIYIPVAAGLLTFGPLLYLQYYKKDTTPTVENRVGMQQQNIEKSPTPNKTPNKTPKVKTAADSTSSPIQKVVEIMNRNSTPEQQADPTFQKMMEIMASDSFQEQVEQQKPKDPKDILQLFAAHGMTEAAEIDFDKIVAEGLQRFEKAYKTRNPGKDPADEDDAMADQLAELIRQRGPVGGVTKFMTNPKNVGWVSFRFKNDLDAYKAWMGQALFRAETFPASRSTTPEESGNFASTSPAPTNVDFPNSMQEDIPSSKKTSPDPFVELEDSTIPDTDNRGSTPLVVEPEMVGTKKTPEPPVLPTDVELEVLLEERFSSERFKRAMETLNQYGPEEGLRRLRESDPEIAKQVEQRRDRVDSGSDKSRPGEDY